MYSLKKIAEWVGGGQAPHLPIASFAIDSRNVQQGAIFFALKGEKVDGHRFLSEVASKGGFAAVVSSDYQGPDFGLFLFRVDDVVAALQEIARRALQERRTKVIGITGSIGKTTTKEFLFELLRTKFRVHKNEGSCNSQRTLPLAILDAKGDEHFLILEMSMTEKGHIRNLARMAPPEIVVLTPIVLCHAKYFSNIEGIAAAKAEIFTEKAEFAVIHEKSARFLPVIEGCTCESIIYPEALGFPSPFVESHLTENVSAVVEVGKYLGLLPEEMELASKRMHPFAHRFEKKQYRGIMFVDDTYNATATSSIAALKNLPKPKLGGKTIVVFGAMADMGKYSFAVHTEVAKEALQVADMLYCIGEEAKPMVEVFEKNGRSVRFFTCYRELEEALHTVAEMGDVVLVKGSNYHKLWTMIK